jgi:hypothetical protein
VVIYFHRADALAEIRRVPADVNPVPEHQAVIYGQDSHA